MLRLVFFAGLGILIGGGIVILVGPPGAGVWAIPVGMLLAIVGGTFALVARSLRPAIGPTAAQVEAARSAGRDAVARVDAIRQTGTQINDQPLCELDITVQPARGEAFRTTVRRIVPLTDIPRYQPGASFAAVYTADDPPVVALVEGRGDAPHTLVPVDAPWRRAEPEAGFGRRPLLGIGRKGRPLRFALYAVVLLMALVAVVIPYREALTQTVQALAQGRLHADMRRPESLSEALAALRQRIGHDAVSSVVVSEDFVIVEAPIVPGETATDRWIYRRGTVENDGPATIQPDLAAEQFRLGDVAWDTLWSLVVDAGEQEGVDDLSATSLSVSRTTDDDIDSDTFAEPVGPVGIVFSVGDDYHDVFYRADADGTALERTD